MRNPIEEKTLGILNRSTEVVRKLPNATHWLDEINALKMKVHEPCTLAVGGRVKAGKSTFINTLLGENLAQVGLEETTATINYFVYGKPQNPQKPIKVVYKNGVEEFVDRSFMNSFQGHDAKSRAMRKNVLYFEWQLEKEILKDITLIDTPGTGSINEDHDEAADVVFGISAEEKQELRKEHDKQTRELTKTADAVIYLVGLVANADNQNFLNDFQEACDGSSALNAIGVLSRIDEKEDVLYSSKEQAAHVAKSLREQLSNVLPVSVCLYNIVKEKNTLFPSWQMWLKTIPEEIFDKYLSRDDAAWGGKYDASLKKKYPDLLPAEMRSQMKGDIPWGPFRAIIKTLYTSNTPEIATEALLKLSNFEEVNRILKEQFFERAQKIRCTVLLKKLSKILLEIRQNAIYSIKRAAKKSEEWQKLVNRYVQPNEIANEIASFLHENTKTEYEIEEIERTVLNELVRPLGKLIQEMEEQNDDYKMLKEVQALKSSFRSDLYEELCELFGLYGSKPQLTDQQKMERQMFWQGKSIRFTDIRMQEIAAYAAQSYGRL